VHQFRILHEEVTDKGSNRRTLLLRRSQTLEARENRCAPGSVGFPCRKLEVRTREKGARFLEQLLKLVPQSCVPDSPGCLVYSAQ
jgi:hypothetical protein